MRTVWTSEFGVDRPAGLAYDPTRSEFLVAEDRPTGTALLRLGPDEERLGSVTLPTLDAPETLAFDAAGQQLVGVDDGEQVRMSAAKLDAAQPTTQRVAVEGVDLMAPDSTTFDPLTGTWYVLDDTSDTIAVVPQDDGAQADSLPIAAGDDRVIAVNPADGAPYVLDDASGRIDRLDRDGSVRTSFDVAPSLLADPVAMAFAPTTDSTDDPRDTNLFVADAGGARTLGGVVELSLAAVAAPAAPTDTATLVRTTQTSSWSPASPDPSGVVWAPASDELVVVDSEVEEKTGAGWHNVKLWRSSRVGAVVGTGTTHGTGSAGSYSREPTGLGYDNATATLFVSDDDAGSIFAVRRGGDGRFGTADDAISPIGVVGYGGVDTEDPEFDPVSGDLFYLDGVSREIYRIRSADGIFGNGNDTMTHFDISHLGPTDFEGLTSNPARGTLYVGARTTKQIFEITHDGTLLRTISATGISGLTYISGLAMAPASNGAGQMNLWIVDRAVDNGPNRNENDGRMFEIAAPNIGGEPMNGAPVAVDDTASTTAGRRSRCLCSPTTPTPTGTS